MPKKVLCFLLVSLALLSCTPANSKDQCRENILPMLKANREKATLIRKSIPSELRGKLIQSGPCVIRALRLGIIFGDKKTYPNSADLENSAACLEIENFFLEQKCVCEKLQFTLSRDEETEKSIAGKLAALKTLSTTARKAGIKNKAIRKLVGKAGEIRQCFSQETLKSLDKIELDLAEVIDSEKRTP